MGRINTSEVIDWAKDFLAKSEKEITWEERKEQKKYAILIQHPNDKTLLSRMLDESSQIHNNKKLAKRIKLLIERYGVPQFFSSTEAFQLRLFTYFGYWFYSISVPLFKKRLRHETSNIIIDEKASHLNQHLSERNKQQIGQNVNLLGEVVLGDAEANRRYEHYLEALKNPMINYISVKLSGIYAQINPLNYEIIKLELCERMARIYQQSIDYPYLDEQGHSKSKFVNLDMEEYKDTELTLDVFKTVLNLPKFKNYKAGIVVQAYLPDAWNFQTELLDFVRKRVTEGGSPLKMRLVKGANLQMESITSSLKGWEDPVLHSKAEVDANYMHILDRALQPENACLLNIGVASHNFFTIGYAFLLSREMGIDQYVTFEMLEGMANHLPRVIRQLDKQVILYTPVVKNEHFLNAVSYLVRRLDENTGKDNFLSYSFNLSYNIKQWQFLRTQFLKAYELKDHMEAKSYRTQDRNKKQEQTTEDLYTFRNEPDTDFYLKPNRLWADSIREQWEKSASGESYKIPVQIFDKQIYTTYIKKYFDRSQFLDVCICEACLSNLDQVKEVISIAEKDASGWRWTSLDKRNRLLHQVARNLSNQRGVLIGCMAAITGKTFVEGDVEVSEAIDFCRFYPISMKAFTDLKTIICTPKGIILVIPPWNFPLSIPTGGIAAALAGGNTVILKPATASLPVAWELAKCFWDAGVPKDALQIVCTAEREPLNYLTSHPAIKHMILTGGTDTAFRLLENNPTCSLSAETGGKNAIILTASGDRDHAIQNIVTSAFSNAGQKCSACSLLLLEKEVYNDPDFKAKLIDAVTSLHTGSVWDFGNVVGPMISNDNDKLLHAINNLEPGESWLVKPKFADEKHFILKPCVKWGVKPGSFTFQNELFAPLLGVVCIDNLAKGINLVNSMDYGLTSGLQSLDESEQMCWKNGIEAGNLYINRGITGAIVNRQPFGGMKHSAFGGGIKAGSRNYVSCFLTITENPDPYVLSTNNNNKEFANYSSVLDSTRKMRFKQAVSSYQENWDKEFSKEQVTVKLKGERNTFRYLPLKKMALRLLPSDKLCDVFMVLAASKIVKSNLTISMDIVDMKQETIKECVGKDFPILLQTEAEFLEGLNLYERIRTCSNVLSISFYKKAASSGIYIASAKPVIEGRIELLHYLKEQSIAFEYHRYGSILEETSTLKRT